MQIKLTKKSVESALLPPGGRDLWLHDTEVKGLCCRITAQGGRIYTLQTRIDRKLRKIRIGRHGPVTPEGARKIAKKLLYEISAGRNPVAERSERRAAPTFAEFSQRYLEEHATPHKKPRSVRQDERAIHLHLLPSLGSKRLQEVTRIDVATIHHTLRTTPYTANRVRSLLSKMFNLAEAWGLRPDGSNPCRHINKYPEPARERYLSELEVRRLGKAMKELAAENNSVEIRREWGTAFAAVRLLIFTGARLGEILSLRWEYIDFDRGFMRLPDTKTGSSTRALGHAALEILREIKTESDSEWVLPGRTANCHLVDLNKPWPAIRKRAGLDDLRLHDLRHTFASWALGENHSLGVIGALLGHQSTSTTKRYAHLAQAPARVAADSVAGKLSEALGAG